MLDEKQPDLHIAMTLMKMLSPETTHFQMAVIDGNPNSKARPRFGANGNVYSAKGQVAGEHAVGWQLKELFPEPLEGNVAVACVFFRGNRQRIDVDNMLKHVMDAANKICWHDDSQVTAQLGIIELDRGRPRTVIAIGEHITTMERTGRAKKERQCLSCGQAFISKQHDPKFCSRECAARARGEKLSELIPCGWCGTHFKRRTASVRFCSNDCRLASLHENKRSKSRIPARCVDCGAKLSKPGYARCRSCWRERLASGKAGTAAGDDLHRLSE